MIETPADYRSFIFCTANKTPVCSHSSGSRSFIFCTANKIPVRSHSSGLASLSSPLARVWSFIFYGVPFQVRLSALSFLSHRAQSRCHFPQKRIPPQSFTQTLLKFNPNFPNELPQKTLRTLQLKP